MSTTAGSLALAESIPPCDTFLVERLREAGAVLPWARRTFARRGQSAVGAGAAG